MRKYLVTAAIAAVAAVLVSAPALAGKGGTHGSSPSTSNAWITATYSGGKVNLAGCGYAVAPATVVVGLPNGSSQTYAVGVWSTGCLDTAYFVASLAGTYTVTVSQSSGATASTSVLVS
jgi:hypothetical protein